jgi:hypothetical protein
MPADISRRTFLAHSAAIAVTTMRWRQGKPSLRIAVLASPPSNALAMGLTLGAAEASRAASLFGGSFTLVPLPAGDLRHSGVTAVIGDGDCSHSVRLAAAASAAGIPFLNVGCSHDALRTCGGTTFHVVPSEAMCRDARAAAGEKGRVLAWHDSLVRFGADTLNRRFHQRFGQGMTSDAWTAWLATKILWETGLRLRSSDPRALTTALVDDSSQFDGHKGLPLSFRAWDRQLRQPVYVMEGQRPIEVPVAARPGEPARPLLDRLGSKACVA